MQIFNDYKPKLELFYSYAKSYKNIFAEIKSNIEEIQNTVPNNSDKFIFQLIDLISKRSNNSDFREICNLSFYIDKNYFQYLIIIYINHD